MEKKYTMMVAGFDHFQPALSSFMDDETFEWSMTKSELIDELDLDGGRAYRYEKVECLLEIRHEPNNPHDPAALQVFADGILIGYVPRGNLDVLRKLSMLPGLQMHVEIFGGPYKELIYNEEDDFFGEMDPKYFKTRTVKDPYKAVMVFTWNG